MPTEQSYEDWKAELLAPEPPQPKLTLADMLQRSGHTTANGSWESLYEYYQKRDARRRARARNR